jgi:hypothetical protein
LPQGMGEIGVFSPKPKQMPFWWGSSFKFLFLMKSIGKTWCIKRSIYRSQVGRFGKVYPLNYTWLLLDLDRFKKSSSKFLVTILEAWWNVWKWIVFSKVNLRMFLGYMIRWGCIKRNIIICNLSFCNCVQLVVVLTKLVMLTTTK